MKYDILNGFKSYIDLKLNTNTSKTYYSAVNSLFKDADFSTLQQVSEEYLIEKLRKIKTKNKLSAAKNGLKHLKEYDKRLKIPSDEMFSDIAKHKKNYVKSKGKRVDYDKMMKKVNAGRDLKMKYACRLAAVSGLRVSELSDLEPEDLHFNEDTITVHVRNGKGGKEGDVTCLNDKYLYEHLQEHVQETGPGEKLFYSEAYMRKYAWKQGIEMHDFRRAFAILQKKKLLKEGKSAAESNKVVQEQLRHSRFSNTKRYLYGRKVLIKDKKSDVKRKEGCEDVVGTTSLNEISVLEFFQMISDLDASDLSIEEWDVLKDYTGIHYSDMNRALYDPDCKPSEEMKSRIARLAACIKRKKLSREEIVYRGLNNINSLFNQDAASMTEFELNKKYRKKIFINYGFLSTSVDADMAESFTGLEGSGALLRINVPEGMKGIFLGKISEHDEKEILFQKGSVMVIDEIKVAGNTMLVDMTLVYQITKEG